MKASPASSQTVHFQAHSSCTATRQGNPHLLPLDLHSAMTNDSGFNFLRGDAYRKWGQKRLALNYSSWKMCPGFFEDCAAREEPPAPWSQKSWAVHLLCRLSLGSAGGTASAAPQQGCGSRGSGWLCSKSCQLSPCVSPGESEASIRRAEGTGLMLEKSLHSEISLVCARREVRLIDWGGGSAGKALGDY